jgi:hypothetical protein
MGKLVAVQAGEPEKTMARRELIAPKGDKRYVRRDKEGRFTESDDAGRSLAQDVRQRAKSKAKSGQGDRGDRKAR